MKRKKTLIPAENHVMKRKKVFDIAENHNIMKREKSSEYLLKITSL